MPEEDAGYFITIVQAPAGASLEYTTNVVKQAEKVLMSVPEVESVFSSAASASPAARPNQGLIFTLLKPFDEREEPEQRIQGLLPRIRGPLFGIQDGLVIPFAPPASTASATSAGSRIEVLDQSGRGDIQELGAGTQALVGAVAAVAAS